MSTPSKFCARCGSPLDAADKVCARCGTPVQQPSAGNAAPYGTQPVQPSPAAAPPAPQRPVVAPALQPPQPAPQPAAAAPYAPQAAPPPAPQAPQAQPAPPQQPAGYPQPPAPAAAYSQPPAAPATAAPAAAPAQPQPPTFKTKRKSLLPAMLAIVLVAALAIVGVATLLADGDNGGAQYDIIQQTITAANTPKQVASLQEDLDSFQRKHASLVEGELTKLMEASVAYGEADESEAKYEDMLTALEEIISTEKEPFVACAQRLKASVEADYKIYEEIGA